MSDYSPSGAAPEEWVEKQRGELMDRFRRLHRGIEQMLESGDLLLKIDYALEQVEALEHTMLAIKAVQAFCEEYGDDEYGEEDDEDDEG